MQGTHNVECHGFQIYCGRLVNASACIAHCELFHVLHSPATVFVLCGCSLSKQAGQQHVTDKRRWQCCCKASSEPRTVSVLVPWSWWNAPHIRACIWLTSGLTAVYFSSYTGLHDACSTKTEKMRTFLRIKPVDNLEDDAFEKGGS